MAKKIAEIYIDRQKFAVVEIKTVRPMFDAVRAQTKTAEFRINDDYIFQGNLILEHVCLNSKGEAEEFSPRIRSLVTHIVHGPEFGIPQGYVMMSTRLLSTASDENDDE